MGNQETQVDAVVVGAGFAGVYALHKLQTLGLSVRGFEAGSDFGGTWYWNRYPGARCDVESLDYSFGFNDEIQQEWDWKHRFGFQPDIQSYIAFVADKLGIRDRFTFNVKVLSQEYDEQNNVWTVKTDAGETITARFCIMATGNLTVPNFPDIPGLEDFTGDLYHSARWPEEKVDFTGKRVAVFGTGATGVQIVPKVAEECDQLYVMQRSPNFSVPARNRELTEEELAEKKKNYPRLRKEARHHLFGVTNVPSPTRSVLELTEEESWQKFEELWETGGSINIQLSFNDFMRDERANERLTKFVQHKIVETVKDPETADKLTPKDHPMGSKRICVDTNYYETYNEPNVHLVSLRETPVERIEEGALVLNNGERIDVDALIFATGFDGITGALSRIDVKGRDGKLLRDRWSEGPSSYLGVAIADFPNMFIITGPGSPSVKSNMVLSIEHHVEFIADAIAHVLERDANEVEAELEAEQDWMEHVSEVAEPTLYTRADSWYTGANIPGKARKFTIYVGGVENFRKKCESVKENDWEGFVLS